MFLLEVWQGLALPQQLMIAVGGTVVATYLIAAIKAAFG